MLPLPRTATDDTAFIQLWRSDTESARDEILAGLHQPRASVAPKFFYDTLGSRLFEAICELPEYYPTRTEAAIFDAHLMQIVRSIGLGSTLIDLGAGNCAKAERLFPALQPAQYVPVDISVDFLRDAVERLQHRYPRIPMVGVGMDFCTELNLPDTVDAQRRLFFYPGSSIGNFEPERALQLLQQIRAACDDEGGLLIGVDLVKDAAVLEAAYDDALGVTSSFNLNLLLHVNAVAGTDFNLSDWRHRASFNAAQSRIEMHLVANRDTDVHWDGGARRFAEGEDIHTECSYKYRREDFIELLQQAGFGQVRSWTDERGWFLVCHACAR